MNDIFKNANDKWKDVIRRAVAHDLSAKDHRRRGVVIGIIATVVSAIVGSTVFMTVITQLGLDGKGTISVPSEGWAWLAYVGFGFLSILAPVLTGLQTYMNHPGQVDKHMNSSAEYHQLRGQLNSFIGRYRQPNGEGPTGTKLKEAWKEMADISKDIMQLQRIAFRSPPRRRGSRHPDPLKKFIGTRSLTTYST